MRHSNSGRRSGGVVRLVITDIVHALRIEVTDEGSVSAIPQIPAQMDTLSESGRGLWMVRELSSAWGWNDDETRRVVWFEMAG
ncbi:ATP-binding protein [Sphaerisporangium sp. NBC_01403]|uniref:ATP-binding protein n=1 Tax=Sphaerisporangium sp. NBC_01403 TaxID=2903599 RepID=UPI00324D25DF